jgi:hypothetical protein
LSQSVPPEVLAALKAVGAALVLGVALLVIARAAARWRSSNADADAAGEERDSLWEPDRLKRALIAWLRGLFHRNAPVLAGESNQAATSPRNGSLAAVISVRELYRQLLGLGETAGAHRLAITTPLEHLPSLQQRLEPEADIARLTAAYVRVRYAEQEASGAEVASLQDQLQSVRPRDADG